MMTTKLKLRIYGDPCLRRKSVPVKEVNVSHRQLIKAMLETMQEQKGVGLAAPQVGINEQIFVTDVGNEPLVFINPRIIRKSGSDSLEEGCLSIPGVTVNIKRPTKIKLKYVDQNNKTVEREFVDLQARVIQHETDHLNGKLIIDYASFSERRKLKPQLAELEKESKK